MGLGFDVPDSDEEEKTPRVHSRKQLKRKETLYKRKGMLGMGDKVQLENALNTEVVELDIGKCDLVYFVLYRVTHAKRTSTY